MSRPGRDFELLVKSLERLYADSLVTVTSPDMVDGVVSGRPREVDVTLRSTVGSVPILIAIECRDRAKGGGIEWVEQLRTKQEDIRANKMIAVSRTGFSESARLSARRYGIETRTLKEVTPADKFDWLESSEFVPCDVNCRLVNISIELDSSPEGSLMVDFPGRKLSTDHPIFARKLNGDTACIDDLIDFRWITLKALDIPLDETRTFHALLRMPDPEDGICLKCANENVTIRQIKLEIEVVRTRGTPAVASLFEYRSEEAEVIAQGFDVRIPDDDDSTRLAFHRSGDGQRMSVHLYRNPAHQARRRRSPLFWYDITDGTS